MITFTEIKMRNMNKVANLTVKLKLCTINPLKSIINGYVNFTWKYRYSKILTSFKREYAHRCNKMRIEAIAI